MKNLTEIKTRIPLFGRMGDEYNGAFEIRIGKERFFVIASNGGGWEHVSVSHTKRTPTWEEMSKIKDMFFEGEETVMQLHPPKSEYVNIHDHCLHLWRPITEEILVPPIYMV